MQQGQISKHDDKWGKTVTKASDCSVPFPCGILQEKCLGHESDQFLLGLEVYGGNSPQSGRKENYAIYILLKHKRSGIPKEDVGIEIGLT